MKRFNKELFKSNIYLAISMAILTGFVEGLALLFLHKYRFLQGQIEFLGESPEVIWISIFFDVLLFLVFALGLQIISLVVKPTPIERASLFVFSLLMFYDWFDIFASGRLVIYAILVLAVGVAFQVSTFLFQRRSAFIRFVKKIFPYQVAFAFILMFGIQGVARLKEVIAERNLPPANSKAPNVLVIVVDTLRADHLSSYGYKRDTDTNIARVAQAGVLFTNAYAASSWTYPSHASLLTGRWPSEHGADTDADGLSTVPLDNRYRTIGEALQARGYNTAAFSGNFETFNSGTGFGRGFVHFEDYYQSLSDLAVSSLYGREGEYYVLHKVFKFKYKIDRRLATGMNQHALDWIDHAGSKPFFVFINYFDVHAPYVPPQPYRSRYSTLKEPGGRISTDWGMDEIYLGLTPEQVQEEIDSYDGAIAYVDANINDLLEQLKNRGKLDNTIVIITSDHGESFGEHGLFEHHNSLYHEVIHVPLILWWPGHIPQGLKTDVPVSNKYLPATILNLVDNNENQTEFPGPSLSRVWQDGATSPNDWPYPIAEVTRAIWLPPQHLVHDGNMSSVITSQYQYIEHQKLGSAIYDLQMDPKESTNLAAEPAMKTVLDSFKSYLEKLVGTSKFKNP